MSMNISARELQLKELRQFISNARKRITDITSELKWEPKSLEKGQEMAVCPLDEGHVIPKTKLEDHLEKCKMRKEVYHPEDIQLPPVSVDPSSHSVLKINKNLQASILKQAKDSKPYMLSGFHGEVDDREVPWSSDRLMSTFTSDERSALHSYIIANTVSPGEGKDIPLNEQDLEINFKNKKEEKKEKTPLERLIEERDAKRRKEGKKVHINRKTHTEIIREVILNQMEVYVEWLKAENLVEEDKSETTQPEKVSELSGECKVKNNVLEGEYDSINSKEALKQSCMDTERESFWDNGQYRGKRRDFVHSDSKWKNDKRMESSSWSSTSREEGKQHRNYEFSRNRDYESSRDKDYELSRHKDYEYSRNAEYNSRHHKEFYDRKKRRDYREERNDDCDDEKLPKNEYACEYDYRHHGEFYDRKSKRGYREERNDHCNDEKPPKDEYSEFWNDDPPKIKKEYDDDDDVHGSEKESMHRERKQEKERKHHKKKRHHRDSDSDIDCNSRHKKKKKKHKRSD